VQKKQKNCVPQNPGGSAVATDPATILPRGLKQGSQGSNWAGRRIRSLQPRIAAQIRSRRPFSSASSTPNADSDAQGLRRKAGRAVHRGTMQSQRGPLRYRFAAFCSRLGACLAALSSTLPSASRFEPVCWHLSSPEQGSKLLTTAVVVLC